MPKQRQRTLLEFVGTSSPDHNSPLGKRRISNIEAESDCDSASDPGRIKFERDASNDKNDIETSEDDQPSRSGRSMRLRSSREQTSPSDDSLQHDGKKKVSRRSSHYAQNKRIMSSSEESDTQMTSKRRRLVKRKRPQSWLEGEEEENLANEVDEDRILDSRLRTRMPKKTDFVRNLERLKRRRRGEASLSESEESDASSCIPTTFEGAHPTLQNQENDMMEDLTSSEDHDDFIVQDENAGEIPELPTMFSMGTYQDLSHHFKVICQLFVHLAVKKPRKRRSFMEDELKKNYFSVPLAIARRKLSGMKDSLVTSSIWKPEFKEPLESLPEFQLERLDFSVPLCDACHISGRVATLRGVIGGRRYDRITYEPLKVHETNDDDSNDLGWDLGRFCAARAQVFHLFSHWEYALYHSLRDEVESLRQASSSSNDRVFLPDTQGASPPDDPNDADGIMDWLDGRGIIYSHWVRIKNMMDRARKLEGRKEAEEDIDII